MLVLPILFSALLTILTAFSSSLSSNVEIKVNPRDLVAKIEQKTEELKSDQRAEAKIAYANNDETEPVRENETKDNPGTNPATKPTTLSTPTKSPTRMISAKSIIEDDGEKIILSMKYPSNGGAITGSISGSCSGNISGNYTGPTTRTLNGLSKASCPKGFLKIPVNISYNGQLSSDHETASINYSASALGKTKTGTTKLELE
jgi:hypothetical protein